MLGSLDYGAGGWEHASIRMLATGKVEVVTGTSAHGQGHETAFSQIVADQLGVPFEDVEVIHGDTQSSPKGLDTYGSRSLVVGGIAIVHAADKVVAKAKTIAAHLLEANEDDLDFEAGSFNVKGMPSGSAGRRCRWVRSPSRPSWRTTCPTAWSRPWTPTPPSTRRTSPSRTAPTCARSTSTPRPVARRSASTSASTTSATPINPLIVEGQVHGGLAQGIAQALYEEAVFDDAGNLTTGTFVDYLVPSAADLPSFTTDRTETAVHQQPAGRQGRRRGRHHRLDAGRHQRHRRRAAALRRQRHPDAGHPRTGLAGSAFGCREVGARRRGHHRVRRRQYRHLRRLGRGRRAAVIPAAFDYVRPESVAEAVSALGAAGEDAKVLAGGQSLLPVLRLRLAYPSTLVDLGRVAELRGVRDDGDAIVIGAMTTHHDVMHDPLVAEHAPLIAQATETVADPQVRHRGTFGGALAHADPAGDLGAVALALDCEFVATGPGGARRIAAADFFLDYLTTALQPDELLTAIRVPKLGAGWSSHYEKFNRVAQAWSIVGVAAAGAARERIDHRGPGRADQHGLDAAARRRGRAGAGWRRRVRRGRRGRGRARRRGHQRPE